MNSANVEKTANSSASVVVEGILATKQEELFPLLEEDYFECTSRGYFGITDVSKKGKSRH